MHNGPVVTATPGELQHTRYPEAMNHVCPTCQATVGQACMPCSLDHPHIRRIERAEWGTKVARDAYGHLEVADDA